MLAEGLCRVSRTEQAVSSAVQNATVVKKPKTFCALTRVECILSALEDGDGGARCRIMRVML